MADDEIKPGDTVKLRSGGPLMTVAEIGKEGPRCLWFGPDQVTVYSRTFAANTIKLA